MRLGDDSIADGLLGGVIFALILLLYLISCIGCATTKCPPCVPEVQTVTIKVPVDACEPPEELPTLTYPDFPKVPQGAAEEDWKAFYASVAATVKAREKILLDRIDALEKVLDGYR